MTHFLQGIAQFTCHETRAIPAFTPQPQNITPLAGMYPWRDGQAELTGDMVIHPSTNWAWQLETAFHKFCDIPLHITFNGVLYKL